MNFRILLFTSLFLSLSLISSAQETEINYELNNELIWSDYEFSANYLSGFRSTKDGEHYTASEKNKTTNTVDIIMYPFKDRKDNRTVLIPAKSLVYKGQYLYAQEYSFNQDETKALIATNINSIYRRSYTATYFIYDINNGTIAPLSDKHRNQRLAEFSPDGTKVAFVSENNIYIKDLIKNKVTTVTTDGATNKIINGATDWVYEEEFAITKGFYWSKNGTKLAYYKFDETDVKEFTMKYYGNLYPTLYNFKYPKAGEDNSKLSLHIYELKKKKSTEVKLKDVEYIPRLKWTNDDNQLIALTLNRHQNNLKYNLIQYIKKNKVSTSIVYEEKDEAYVEIDDNLIFLNDGNSFIRTSEKNGFNHIFKIGMDGSSTQITRGEWDVISFKGIDEQQRIYYTSVEEGAIYKSVYRIDLDGTNKTKLSNQKGENDPDFSAGMKYFVNTYTNASTPPQITLCDQNGVILELLEDNSELIRILSNYKLSKKEFFKIKGATDSLNAWMIKPPNFDPNKKYPVYYNVYGGPGSNMVEDNWGGSNYMYHQLLAKKGYIVFCVDPRGTMYQGAKFKKSTYLNLGKLETEDMIATSIELSKLKYVDKDRIGIMGWSYGGYMSSLCITKGASYFKMGIAVAPVTNWRYYDNIYTERFMRTPKENKDGYDDNSPINHVSKMKGKYLLIHGSGDDNVHVQNTMEMVSEMVRKNKQFDLFIYPNKNHGIYGGNTRLHLFNKMLNYTLENL
jgi:dipeptidyl-peptidase-4